MVSAGGGPVAVGGGAEPPGDGRGGVGGELLGPEGALAQVVGVAVGADGVAAAGPAVVLVRGCRAGARFAERGVAFEDADQAAVRVVEQDEPVAGEVVGGLPGEVLRDDAPLEAGRRGDGDERAAGGGPGDPLAGGEAVFQAGGGVGGGQGGLDVEEVVDAVAAAAGVAVDGDATRVVRMCPYWIARATSPPGRRAMCQARLRRKRLVPSAPPGSRGCLPGQPVTGGLAGSPR